MIKQQQQNPTKIFNDLRVITGDTLLLKGNEALKSKTIHMDSKEEETYGYWSQNWTWIHEWNLKLTGKKKSPARLNQIHKQLRIGHCSNPTFNLDHFN